MTVREAADRYIEYLRRKKGGKESTTARSYASTFNLFCDHFEVLNSENVIAFLSRYQNPQTKNKMLWHLTALARRFPDRVTGPCSLAEANGGALHGGSPFGR